MGKKKAPSKNLVLRWVKQAWEEIPEEMVRRSFKRCGISNALNGTEDDATYDDKMPEVADDDMEDEFETDSEEDDDDLKLQCHKLQLHKQNSSFGSHHIN